jgi:hypothetical protein
MEFPSVILLVNPLVIKNIITEGYTDEMKRVILFFIIDGFTDGQKITDERFTDGEFPSVISSVN